ncbi:hypothetical protein Tco_0933226, partial [Tanacetum coccineum]
FNTTAGNPVKKILLKLNLSDHRLFKDGGGVNESQERRSIKVFQDNHSRKMLKITMSNTSSRNKLNPEINDHYNILTRECQKDELKTKDKALSLNDFKALDEFWAKKESLKKMSTVRSEDGRCTLMAERRSRSSLREEIDRNTNPNDKKEPFKEAETTKTAKVKGSA